MKDFVLMGCTSEDCGERLVRPREIGGIPCDGDTGATDRETGRVAAERNPVDDGVEVPPDEEAVVDGCVSECAVAADNVLKD